LTKPVEGASISLACARQGKQALRAALVSSVALAMLAGLASSADAAYRRYRPFGYIKAKPAAARASNPERDGFAEMPKAGVLQIGISIGSQRVTVFRDGKRIVQGPISSGTASHPTPMGVFSVIEKDRHHRSNIYSAAPMPFMQRITWSGVAMHEGVLPGVPASHGCIRLLRDFATRLWPTTKLGVRVIVSRQEIARVEFDHPSLFAPKPKPTEPPVAMIDPADGAKPHLLVHLAEATTTVKDAGGVDVTRSAEPAKPAAPETNNDRKPPDTAAVVETKPVADGVAAEKPPAQPAAAVRDDDAVREPGTVISVPPQDGVSALPELRKAVEIPIVAEPAVVAPVAEPKVAEPKVVEPKAPEAGSANEEAVKPAPTGVDAPKRPQHVRAADRDGADRHPGLQGEVADPDLQRAERAASRVAALRKHQHHTAAFQDLEDGPHPRLVQFTALGRDRKDTDQRKQPLLPRAVEHGLALGHRVDDRRLRKERNDESRVEPGLMVGRDYVGRLRDVLHT